LYETEGHGVLTPGPALVFVSLPQQRGELLMATEHPNVELARRAYEAMAKGDLAPFLRGSPTM
jgi:hypothetical protein